MGRGKNTGPVFDSHAEYTKFYRIVTGTSRHVRMDVDTLRKAFCESQTLQDHLSPGLVEALIVLNNTDGVPVKKPGSGNYLSASEEGEAV